MKNLTEIVKNIKTSGKNLIVYSSMLLTLGGAYACGGNDNPSNNTADAQVLQDGGDSNQDGGSNNQNGAIDCDNLCLNKKLCKCGYDVEGCKTECQNSQEIFANIRTDELNSLNDCLKGVQVYGECNGSGHSCGSKTLFRGGDCASSNPFSEAYCNKKVECGRLAEGKTKDDCLNGIDYDPQYIRCFSSNWFAKNAQSNIDCMNNIKCSAYDEISNCEVMLHGTPEVDEAMQILHCNH